MKNFGYMWVHVGYMVKYVPEAKTQCCGYILYPFSLKGKWGMYPNGLEGLKMS
jgi:hypothetical protein